MYYKTFIVWIMIPNVYCVIKQNKAKNKQPVQGYARG